MRQNFKNRLERAERAAGYVEAVERRGIFLTVLQLCGLTGIEESAAPHCQGISIFCEPDETIAALMAAQRELELPADTPIIAGDLVLSAFETIAVDAARKTA